MGWYMVICMRMQIILSVNSYTPSWITPCYPWWCIWIVSHCYVIIFTDSRTNNACHLWIRSMKSHMSHISLNLVIISNTNRCIYFAATQAYLESVLMSMPFRTFLWTYKLNIKRFYVIWVNEIIMPFSWYYRVVFCSNLTRQDVFLLK